MYVNPEMIPVETTPRNEGDKGERGSKYLCNIYDTL
jgi:hypothetical protein